MDLHCLFMVGTHSVLGVILARIRCFPYLMMICSKLHDSADLLIMVGFYVILGAILSRIRYFLLRMMIRPKIYDSDGLRLLAYCA
jgi:hypothetical protein